MQLYFHFLFFSFNVSFIWCPLHHLISTKNLMIIFMATADRMAKKSMTSRHQNWMRLRCREAILRCSAPFVSATNSMSQAASSRGGWRLAAKRSARRLTLALYLVLSLLEWRRICRLGARPRFATLNCHCVIDSFSFCPAATMAVRFAGQTTGLTWQKQEKMLTQPTILVWFASIFRGHTWLPLWHCTRNLHHLLYTLALQRPCRSISLHCLRRRPTQASLWSLSWIRRKLRPLTTLEQGVQRNCFIVWAMCEVFVNPKVVSRSRIAAL